MAKAPNMLGKSAVEILADKYPPYDHACKYSPEYAEIAKNYTLLGASKKQLADFFEVSESTLLRWMKDFAPFRRAIQEGSTHADARVAAALYKRAIGYTRETKAGRGENGEQIMKETHYPPDVAACIYWLKARRKKEDDGEMWMVKDGDDAKPKIEIDDVELARRVAFILTKALHRKEESLSAPTIDVTPPSNSK